jgi:Tfp pilus assembly protein PilO
VTSYEGEKKLIKKCKDLNNKIFEKATSVRAAIRVASAVVEEINALKNKVSKDYEELSSKRDKEEKQRQKIQALKIDIANLKRLSHQATDLEEDSKLQQLSKIVEEMMKQRDD